MMVIILEKMISSLENFLMFLQLEILLSIDFISSFIKIIA